MPVDGKQSCRKEVIQFVMDEPGDLERAFGGVISAANLIDTARDTDSFKEWVEQEHDHEDYERLLDGYKFFLETAFRNLIHEVIYSSIPQLEEDFIFFRARFKGVELSKIPNTCQKTAFIKNVNSHRSHLRKGKTWDEVRDVLDEFDRDVIRPLFKLFDEYCIVEHDTNPSKEDILHCSTIFRLFAHFNDVDDGYPNGYFLTILASDLRKDRLEKSLEGYILALQFVWSELVGEQTYRKSSLSHLHESTEWSTSFDPFSNFPSRGERADLDRFFGDIRDELILPMEKEFGYSVLDRAIYLDENAPFEPIQDLITSENEVQLNIEEEFNRQLMWYEVEFLQASRIFNGVPAFISLLSGRVDLKRRHADGEKTFVCKFTHPVEPGNDYTYGVLVEAWGTTGMGDYSGWLMFYDCCGDYSGFAGSEHMHAETLIEEYQDRDLIELREMELPKQEFQDLISDLSVGDKGEQLTEKMELESERNRLREKVSRARGLLVEFITYYYASRREPEEWNVDWNVPVGGGEIDVEIEGPDSIRHIECKYDPTTQNLNDQISKLTKKVIDSNNGKSAEGEFWFWHEPRPEVKSVLKEHGFDYKIVEEIVTHDPVFHEKDIQHIQHVMKKTT